MNMEPFTMKYYIAIKMMDLMTENPGKYLQNT